MNLGDVALAIGFANGIAALICYFRWVRGHIAMRSAARRLTAAMAIFVGAAGVFHLINIVTHQFHYEYVRDFSDRSLPTLLLITTFWGGQAGSFLLWAVWSALFAVILLLGLRRTTWEPYVLTPYLLVTICIVGITWASGPFKTLAEVPFDGNGLNPLLQNYWMAIHPPILFTGFTTMAGPFAFAVAALWKRDYDGWVRMAHPWTALAWTCMGAGLALGGFWAYESLGWGGFWGWDPVENSSFVPWLLASGLLHGFILQRSRGSLKRTNLALAVFGYLTVIYSTFLTRSGVLGDFSVHSFVELGLMGYLLLFIAIFALLGFGMLAWRWRGIGRRVIFTHVLSREFGLLLCVVLFVAIAVIVGLGTSMPVITLLPVFASQMSIDLGTYGPTVAPFGLLILLTMAIGPLLGWQHHKYGSLCQVLKWPAILTALILFACLLLNIIYPVALLFIAAAVFATATNAVVIARIWRAGPLKLGGYLAHVGVGLLFVGIIGTSVYKQTASLQLTQDVPQRAFGRQFTFRGMVLPPDDALQRTAIQIEVMDPQDGSTWVAEAPYYVYPKTGQLVTHPDIQAGLASDLYVAPSQYIPAPQAEPGLLQLVKEQAQEILGYTFTFKAFELPNREAMMRGEAPPLVTAIIDVTAPDGTATTIEPSLLVEIGQSSTGAPVALPGGATVAIRGVDPANQMVHVQLGGIDLSRIDPDDLRSRVFVEVSREPGIKLVWGGFIIGVLGGLLALVRRWRERRLAAHLRTPPRPVPTPQRGRSALQPGTVQMITPESEVAS